MPEYNPFAIDRQRPQERQHSPESELGQLSMFNESQLYPGQVVAFQEAMPLREPGIEQHELGVVRSLHRGGITYDYAVVELVGGRLVQVYQGDPVTPAPPEIDPAEVLGQQPAPEQRDPHPRSVLPLQNGNLIQRGDLVRFADPAEPGIEVGQEARVLGVHRHTGNRAELQLSDGRQVEVLTGAPLEIVHPAPAEQQPEAGVPATMPARTVEETVAREQALRGNLRELLASYRSRGQLEYSGQPEWRAIELAEEPRWEWPIEAILADTQFLDRWLPDLNELLGRDLRPAADPADLAEPQTVLDARGYANLMEFLFPSVATSQGVVTWRSRRYPEVASQRAQSEGSAELRHVWEAIIRHVVTALSALERVAQAGADPAYRILTQDHIRGPWVATLRVLVGKDHPNLPDERLA